MDNSKVYGMSFEKVYMLLINKALRKNRTQEEVEAIIHWLTGYDEKGIADAIEQEFTYQHFFEKAPLLNPNRCNIKGSICGVKIEEIQEPIMKEIRYLDKLIDELAKGKEVEKILMKYN